MGDVRRAAALGSVAAVAVVVLLVVPYIIADPRAVGVYYGASIAGPPLAGLFALVAGLALAAGARGRTDPPTGAGVALVLSALAAGLLVPWAIGVSPALVGGMTTVAAFGHHRWALVAGSVLLLAAAGWFARSTV